MVFQTQGLGIVSCLDMAGEHPGKTWHEHR